MDNNIIMKNQVFEKEKKYWINKLSMNFDELNFSGKHNQSKENRDGSFCVAFEKDIVHDVIRISKNNNLAIYTILLTSFKIFLWKLTDQENIAVSAPIYGEKFEKYNNAVILLDTICGQMSFKDFLMSVRKTVMEAYNNQHCNIESIIESLGAERCNSLFQNSFIMDNIHNKTLMLKFLEEYSNSFIFSLHRNEEELSLEVIYDTGVFEDEFVETLIEAYMYITHQVLKNSNILLSEIKLVKKESVNWNIEANSVNIEEKTIHELFENQVKNTPDNIAVVIGDKRLTYSELNNKANQLARILKTKGVKSDVMIGIMSERSLEMIIGILAILKAGGAYVPIDPKYPKERINYILEDSNITILLSQKNFITKLGIEKESLYLDDETLYQGEMSDLKIENSCSQLAYAVYTSGSTGKPKGVMIEHRSILNYILWRNKNYGYDSTDVTLQLISIAFDGFGANLYSSILAGGRLVLIDEDHFMDYKYITQVIEQEGVTNFSVVPSMYKAILEFAEKEHLKTIRFVVLAGEKADDMLINKSSMLASNIQLINEYGPTENSVGTTSFIKMDAQSFSIIGKPIANNKVYILNQQRNIVPNGVPGELCISGAGLSRGYLNDSELTAKKFFDSPFVLGERMYKTGDLARRLHDGNIEFLGRIDNQVKIRGFRIELEEIESELLNFEVIREAVVVDRQDLNGDKYLCAYIISSREITITEVKSYLSERLPEYMIPTQIVLIDQVPRTPNGKIHRALLMKREEKIERQVEYIIAQNETEETLIDMYKEILGLDNVGTCDSFFDLGGNSLKATMLISKIYKNFNVEITLSQIFKCPTIKDIAEIIEKANKSIFEDIHKVAEAEYYQLSYNQKRLWIIQQLDTKSQAYNIPGVIKFNKLINEEALKRALAKLVERHESFRTGFKIVDGNPVQYVVRHVEIPYKFIDISMFEDELCCAKKEEIIQCITQRAFDINALPLCQFVLIKINEIHFELVFNIHHIISDGWSMEIIKKEFQQLYEGYINCREIELEPLKLQYKDFAAWKNKVISDKGINSNSHKFWLDKIKQGIPVLKLPFDSIGNLCGKEGAAYRCVVFQQVKDKLIQFSNKNSISLFTTMFSAYNILLSHLTGQEDITCAVPNAGREHISVQNIVGFFVNSVILINHVEHNEDFVNFTKRVNRNVLEAFSHQNYPIEIVLEECDEKYPDISTSFNMLNMDENVRNIEVQSFESYHIDKIQDVKYALNLYIKEYKNSIELYCSYKKELFNPMTIERIMNGYVAVLNSIAEGGDEECK